MRRAAVRRRATPTTAGRLELALVLLLVIDDIAVAKQFIAQERFEYEYRGAEVRGSRVAEVLQLLLVGSFRDGMDPSLRSVRAQAT